MNYIEALQKRYSVKKFNAHKIVPKQALENILLAGQLSVSSLGLQPYQILIVESPEVKKKLIPAFYNPSQISTCSHLIVLISKKSIDQQYIDNYFEHIKKERNLTTETLHPFRKNIEGYISSQQESALLDWTERQTYIALGNLIFAAALENVDTCPMEGFREVMLEEILEINPEIEKISVTLALGFRAGDDPFQTMKKVRKPDTMLFKYL